MKKIFFTLTLFTLALQFQAQIVNIPDANFKNALLYTLCVDSNGDGVFDSDADINNDLEIQVSEAEVALGLDVGLFLISSLEGISYFKNIEILYCDYNKLTSLDISKNTKLKFLECTLNQIANLDISKNPNLENLYCPSNNLTSLDVSEHPNLEILECAYNELTALDVSHNPSLTTLICFKNKLNSLNIKNGNNTMLTTVSAKFNSDLTCIEVDDVDASINNSNWIKDSIASYSENCGVLSSNDFENELQILCYPNPVSSMLKIKTPISDIINGIKVYDTFGKLVIKEELNFEQLDLSNLKEGLFFVIIETNNNSFTRKIVKK